MITKICKKCGKEKPVEEFHWENKKQNKRNSKCGKCVNEYHRERYKRPDVKIKQREYEKRPEVRKRRIEHEKQPHIRQRNSKYNKEYRARPDIKERDKRWRMMNQGRLGKYRKYLPYLIDKKRYNTCPICDRSLFDDPFDNTADHIVPISHCKVLGWSEYETHHIYNLRAVCYICNDRRKDNMEEYIYPDIIRYHINTLAGKEEQEKADRCCEEWSYDES